MTNDKFLCHHSSWHGICHFPLMIPRQSLFQQSLMQETLCTSPLHSKNNTNTTKTKQIWGKKEKRNSPRIWQPDPKRIKTYSTKINPKTHARFIPHTHSSKRWILARPAPITNRPLGAEKREKWRKKGEKQDARVPLRATWRWLSLASDSRRGDMRSNSAYFRVPGVSLGYWHVRCVGFRWSWYTVCYSYIYIILIWGKKMKNEKKKSIRESEVFGNDLVADTRFSL